MNEAFKNAIGQIDVPAGLHARCAAGIAAARRRVRKQTLRRLTAAAAVMVVIGGAAVAASINGYFKDMTRWDGAVVGAQYAQATDEIDISIAQIEHDGGALAITLDIRFLYPDTAPYRYIEHLAVSRACVVDAGGETTASSSAEATVAEGSCRLVLRFPAAPEDCKALHIGALHGFSKADAPLEITGEWICGL